MSGYVKGTTPDGEMAHIREAFSRATSAIQAWPDPVEALEASRTLTDLIEELRTETRNHRDWLAARMADTHSLTHEELAVFMGVSRAAVSQRIARARERERKKGNPVTEPLTLPEQPHVALAVITSDRGVLIARRNDRIPPWTFIGGEIGEGETPGSALRRKVQHETGLEVRAAWFIGRRLHPKTSRVMVYGHVEVEPGEPRNGDPGDLAEVRWASIDETRELMPDMYGPVRAYLDELNRVELGGRRHDVKSRAPAVGQGPGAGVRRPGRYGQRDSVPRVGPEQAPRDKRPLSDGADDDDGGCRAVRSAR